MASVWIKRHFKALQRLTMLACALPALGLLLDLHRGHLGATPLNTLLQVSGRSSLVILIATLSITPLRRLLALLAAATRWKHGKRMADWNWLVKLRRPLGLWSFAYATLHLWLYLAFDLAYDWATAWEELRTKAYLLAGFVAWALLVPLALTSTQRMMRALGRHWMRLHAAVYLIALLSLLHFWLLTKHGASPPWPDTLALAALLLYRALLKTGLLLRWQGDDGTESPERARA